MLPFAGTAIVGAIRGILAVSANENVMLKVSLYGFFIWMLVVFGFFFIKALIFWLLVTRAVARQNDGERKKT
jgi:hypothetical protein